MSKIRDYINTLCTWVKSGGQVTRIEDLLKPSIRDALYYGLCHETYRIINYRANPEIAGVLVSWHPIARYRQQLYEALGWDNEN